jgi:hypothetical protein
LTIRFADLWLLHRLGCVECIHCTRERGAAAKAIEAPAQELAGEELAFAAAARQASSGAVSSSTVDGSPLGAPQRFIKPGDRARFRQAEEQRSTRGAQRVLPFQLPPVPQTHEISRDDNWIEHLR